MMFAHLCDPALPALQGLQPDDLDRITGTARARLLRARYQPGARAVLHVALEGGGEGSIWFFAGTKAQGLARRLPDARLDARTGALFERFPQDHRLPQLARFMARAQELAPGLIGGPLAAAPQLLRYRPGLSATFRLTRDDGAMFFAKQTADDDVQAQARRMAELAVRLGPGGLQVPQVAGFLPALGLIAYAAAKGMPLDSCLQGADPLQAAGLMTEVQSALQTLWSLPLRPARVLGRSALLARAEQAGRMITLLDRQAGDMAAALLARLRQTAVPVQALPIHADIKLEHLFLSGPQITLIDTESLSFGDPDYDLGQLQTRLVMAGLDGALASDTVKAAVTALRAQAGPNRDWFVSCARLQGARFYAQRFDPAAIPRMRRLLGDPADLSGG